MYQKKSALLNFHSMRAFCKPRWLRQTVANSKKRSANCDAWHATKATRTTWTRCTMPWATFTWPQTIRHGPSGLTKQDAKKVSATGWRKGCCCSALGAIYWDKRLFEKAQQCYTDALGLIDKEHDNYEEITRRSKVLDKSVPFTSAIALQDSLQALSRMSEAATECGHRPRNRGLEEKGGRGTAGGLDLGSAAWSEENGQTGSNQTNNNPTTQKPRPG